MCGDTIGNKMICYNNNMTICYSAGAFFGMLILTIAIIIIFIIYKILSVIKECCISSVNLDIDEETSLYDISSNTLDETIKEP